MLSASVDTVSPPVMVYAQAEGAMMNAPSAAMMMAAMLAEVYGRRARPALIRVHTSRLLLGGGMRPAVGQRKNGPEERLEIQSSEYVPLAEQHSVASGLPHATSTSRALLFGENGSTNSAAKSNDASEWC